MQILEVQSKFTLLKGGKIIVKIVQVTFGREIFFQQKKKKLLRLKIPSFGNHVTCLQDIALSRNVGVLLYVCYAPT
jgi:hypothetical protein